MQVIGKDAKGNYIAVVTHEELEKVAGKYYGKMTRLEIGQEFSLSAGYDYAADIKRACTEMLQAVNAFKGAQNTMMKFAVMVSETAEKKEPASEQA